MSEKQAFKTEQKGGEGEIKQEKYRKIERIKMKFLLFKVRLAFKSKISYDGNEFWQFIEGIDLGGSSQFDSCQPLFEIHLHGFDPGGILKSFKHTGAASIAHHAVNLHK